MKRDSESKVGPGDPGDTLLTVSDAGAFLKVSRWMVAVLVEREALPCVLIAGGGGRRRVLRFERERLQEWIAGRREAQVRRLLDGTRHTRRRTLPIAEGG